ncbi:hypothetical protein [Actinophytocola gossypii]|uniref:Uncharacterized protein n=1 Tax=Actinophytocola gossypii TaxID=2812003 RepID=A0ABT2JGL4_9PSEU|nr:hypothetical protein [Actinophytocola gossypii]MCT2586669.1 hypothetical protein [Actinophytocola gossypii]
MVQAVLLWAGVVVGLGLMLVMALGPVIVEADARRYERRHDQRRVARREAAKAAVEDPAASAPVVRHAA